MKKYASDLPDFADLLQVAAGSKKIPAAIIEKDYYLTRALRALAEGHCGEFVLKGGTSLSKGWQMLQRFSEDIDLLVRAGAQSGKTARHTRLKGCATTIERTEGFTFHEVRDSEEGIHRAVAFSYSRITTDLPGLGNTVLLEAGYRGNASEANVRHIQSILSEFAATLAKGDLAADLSPFDIEVQNLRRTFVEKLFAAHAAFTKNFAAEGKARHYYDLYEICKLEDIRVFAGTEEYRKCVTDVRQFSQEAFPQQAIPKTDSFATSHAFQPDTGGLAALEGNYRAESDLFFGVQPPITDVLNKIGELLSKL